MALKLKKNLKQNKKLLSYIETQSLCIERQRDRELNYTDGSIDGKRIR